MEDILDLYINISENNEKTKVDIDDKEENGVLPRNKDEIINKITLTDNCKKDKNIKVFFMILLKIIKRTVI